MKMNLIGSLSDGLVRTELLTQNLTGPVKRILSAITFSERTFFERTTKRRVGGEDEEEEKWVSVRINARR